MSKLFGTDGVRGIANKELTPDLAYNLGKAGAIALAKENQGKTPLVLIGKDTRISGDMLEDALAAGIMSVGGNVGKLGVLPTPAIAYLARYYKAEAGVVISASHNTFEYNGIKFFNGKGFKLGDSIEDEIEEMIFRGVGGIDSPIGKEIGRVVNFEEDPKELYIESLLRTTEVSLKGKKIVLDCANGASSEIAHKVYERLGAEVITISNSPDGVNINEACGSTHPEELQKVVIENNAHIGMAFDGDADRLIGVDDKGRIVDGDKLICICGRRLKQENKLKNDEITVTVMSNVGLHRFAEENGINVTVTKVGDRYVLESMVKTGSVLGGEQSGHMILLDHTTTGDGVLSSLQVCETVVKSGKTFSQLSDEISIYPQVLINAKVSNDNKKKIDKDQEIQSLIKTGEEKLSHRGRILIRPSGTEPVVRVMIEGQKIDEIEKMAKELADLIQKKYEI